MAGANLTIGVNSSEFKSAMSEMSGQLRGLQSEFNLAKAKANLYGNELDSLKAKKTALTDKIKIQKTQTEQLKNRMIGVKVETSELSRKQHDLSQKIDETSNKYKLSCEQTGKTSEESKKLKSELDKLKEQYAQTENAIKSKGNELERLRVQFNNTEAAIMNNEAELENLTKEMSNLPFEKVSQGFYTVGEKIETLGRKWSVASGVILGAGVAAFKMSTNFEDAMAKVMTIADETVMSQEELEKAIMDLSNQTGISASEIAENVYSAISAGQQTGDAVNFLTNATKLAKAGFTDTGSALDVLTTILNSYGLEAEEVSRISDILMKTQNEGKTTVGELAQSIGKVIPTAKGANVSIEQLGASYSLMTSKGVATAETTTYVNSMIDELAKSGSETGNVLKEKTGKSFQELMESGMTLGDALAILEGAAKESGKSLNDMFSSSEAGKAALILATEGGAEFNDMLNKMSNSAGETDDAFKKVDATTNEKLKKSFNEIKNTATEFGDAIVTSALPTIEKFGQGVKEASEWFKSLDDNTKENIVKLGGFIVVVGPALVALGSFSKGISNTVTGIKDMCSFTKSAIDVVKGLDLKLVVAKGTMIATTIATKGAAIAQAGLNLVMSLNPIGLVIAGLVALAAGLVVMWNKCEWFRESVTGLWNALKEGISDFVEKTKEFFTNLGTSIKEKWNEIKEGITNKCKEIATNVSNKWTEMKTDASTKWNEIKTNLSNTWDNIKTSASQKWTDLKTAIANKWTEMKTDASTKWNDIKTTLSTTWGNLKTLASDKFSAVKEKISSSWNGIKTATREKWEEIKSVVSKAIDKLKGFMKFKWELPKIKLPHFSISGKFSLNPPSIPKFGVEWYHTGAIFKKRTILPNGIGVGDKYKGSGNNAEAIIPLDSMYRNIANIIRREFDRRESNRNSNLKVVIENFNNNTDKDIQTLMDEIAFEMKRRSLI